MMVRPAILCCTLFIYECTLAQHMHLKVLFVTVADGCRLALCNAASNVDNIEIVNYVRLWSCSGASLCVCSSR